MIFVFEFVKNDTVIYRAAEAGGLRAGMHKGNSQGGDTGTWKLSSVIRADESLHRK